VNATKHQTVASIGDDEFLVVETSSFTGIPYGDHFVVVARWFVLSGAADDGTSYVDVQIAVEVLYRFLLLFCFII